MEVEHFNEYEYDELDCSTLPMFSGGFVNFGLWKNLDYKSNSITATEREKSSIELYSEVVKYLNITSSV